MSPDRRAHLQTQAYLRAPIEVGPYTLRSISATSFILLQEIGNPLITSSEGVDIMSPEGITAAFEFIYVHAAPLVEVIKTTELPSIWQARRILEIPDSDTLNVEFEDELSICRQAQKNRIRAAVLAFASDFPQEILADALAAIRGETEIAAAAVSEAESPSDDEEDESPNGQRRRGSRAASQQSQPNTTGRKSSSRGNSR